LESSGGIKAPFAVDRFMFYSSRRLYCLIAEVVSRPGVLASVTSLIADRGLDIAYCSTRAARAGDKGVIHLFIDFTDTRIRPETLAGELEALKAVKRVEVIRPTVEGFISNGGFPLIIGPVRAVLLDEAALKGLLIEFRKRLGTGGEAMLYHLGVEIGRERWRYILRQAEGIGVGEESDRLLIMTEIFKSMGYGIPEIVERNDKLPYIAVRVWRNIECELAGRVGHPYSHFIRGLLAGLIGLLYDVDMRARETKCIAAGDPYCLFEITAK